MKKLDKLGPEATDAIWNEIGVMAASGLHPNLVALKGWYRWAGALAVMLCCVGMSLNAQYAVVSASTFPCRTYLPELFC